MEKRIIISNQGPELSRITAGVWKWGLWGHQLKSNDILELIEGCLGLGVTTFDHADIYGDYTDEAAFGKALAMQPALRNQIEIITKCGIKMESANRPEHQLKSYDTSAGHIIKSVENSLRNLNTDHIDLLLIHRPDPLMNPMEVAETADQLKKAGKVLHFGVSNFTGSQFAMLNSFTPLCTNQIEISLGHVEPLFDGVLDLCLEKKVAPMAWSPLGSGKFFGTEDVAEVAEVKNCALQIGAKHGISLDQVLLAWLLKHPSGIIPVLGTAKISRIQKAVETLEIELDREDWFKLLEAAVGREVP